MKGECVGTRSAEDRWDAFVSHSSKDKPRVRQLVAELRKRGFNLWVDEEQIHAGDSIPLKVEDGIEHSDTVIVCLSGNFLSSDWTPAERAAFSYDDPQNKRPTQIPVLLAECQVPRALKHLRMVHYLEHNEVGIDEIAKAIERAQRSAKPIAADGDASHVIARVVPPSRHADGIQDPSEALPLTELSAIAALRETLDRALHRSRALHQGLIVIDLDRFTQLNRMYGHHAADLVIVEVHNAVGSWCEASVETVMVDHTAVWRGMDEWFVVVASRAPLSGEALSDLAKDLLERVRSIDLSGISPDLFVGASAGVVLCKDQESPLDLLRRGLAGLKLAKRESPGSVRVGPQIIRPVASENAGLLLAAQDISDLDSGVISVSDDVEWKPEQSEASYYGVSGRPRL